MIEFHVFMFIRAGAGIPTDRWCRVGRTFYDRASAQSLAEQLSGDGNRVKVVRFELGEGKGVIIWEDPPSRAGAAPEISPTEGSGG